MTNTKISEALIIFSIKEAINTSNHNIYSYNHIKHENALHYHYMYQSWRDHPQDSIHIYIATHFLPVFALCYEHKTGLV